MTEESKISVPTIRILESLSRSLHAAEVSLRQVHDEAERARLADLIFEMKKTVGSFFRQHVDRRKQDRGTSPVGDYEGYLLGEKTLPEGSPPGCPFCESANVVFRRRDLSGTTYWYCTSCHQEVKV